VVLGAGKPTSVSSSSPVFGLRWSPCASSPRSSDSASGTFSPTLKTGIALALVDAGVALDDAVTVDVRSRAEPFTVVKPPFVTPGVREP